MTICFNKNYFTAAALLFITEVLIAVYFHDELIRPYFGDYLVVILMYCAIKSFFKTPALKTATFVLLFSFAIELGQYFNLLHLLGLEHSKIAATLLGTSFGWFDLVAYAAGVLTVLGIEYRINNNLHIN